MELILLGTGTAVPSLKRSSSAYLLKINNKNILIDCGPGTVRRLLDVGVTYNDIDLILITHLHPDHTADLVPLLFANRYHGRPRVKELPMTGGKGFSAFLSDLDKTFDGALSPQLYKIPVKEVDDESWKWEGIGFFSRPLRHTEISRGYVLERDGKRAAFTGDTGYSSELVELASGVNLLVCECSFPDEMGVDGHLTPSEAAMAAEEAGVERLVLSHFYPEVEKEPIKEMVKKVFSGEVIIGEDLLRVYL